MGYTEESAYEESGSPWKWERGCADAIRWVSPPLTHTRRVSPPLTQLLRVGTLSVKNVELWSAKNELQ